MSWNFEIGERTLAVLNPICILLEAGFIQSEHPIENELRNVREECEI
jgi:hypothetical protein